MSKEPMYIDIYNALLKEIVDGHYQTGDMLPTEQEMEKKYFVSRVTIRKALKLLFDDGLIKRVSGRGTYVDKKDFIGSGMTKNKRTIGMIVSNAEHSFGSELILATEKMANDSGYTLIFKNSHDNIEFEKKAISDLLDIGVCGLIIQPIREEFYNESIIKLHMRNFPLVLIDRDLPGFPIPCVSTNNFNAAFEATNYLIKKGHTNITFFCPASKNTNTITDRKAGFQNAFYENHILFTEWNTFSDIKSPIETQNPTSFEDDVESIKKFLANNPQITCLFASEYIIAKMLIQALTETNKKIPDDYSVAMFDNTPSLFPPHICHVKQDENEIGRTAVATLLGLISDKKIKHKIYIPHHLITESSIKELK